MTDLNQAPGHGQTNGSTQGATPPSTHALFADHAYLPDGWRRNVLLTWDATGTLTHVSPDTSAPPPGVSHAAGPVLPGMPNLHSHAFQRAMAGLTEYRANATDNFSRVFHIEAVLAFRVLTSFLIGSRASYSASLMTPAT